MYIFGVIININLSNMNIKNIKISPIIFGCLERIGQKSAYPSSKALMDTGWLNGTSCFTFYCEQFEHCLSCCCISEYLLLPAFSYQERWRAIEALIYCTSSRMTCLFFIHSSSSGNYTHQTLQHSSHFVTECIYVFRMIQHPLLPSVELTHLFS